MRMADAEVHERLRASRRHRFPSHDSSGIGSRKRRHGGDAPRPSPGEGREHKRRRTGDGDGSRAWVFSSRDFSSYKDRFVIVSYNILGVENASKHQDLYQQVEPRDLDWEQRKRRIRRELRRYNPGILCFQEVDHFDDLADLLHKDGYKGVYKGRTGEANDGCAIFWRKEWFALLCQENIEFEKFGLRNNVAQLCMFKMQHNHKCSYTSTSNKAGIKMAETTLERTFLVGNIHLLFNPNRGDIKLGQIRLLLEKAHTLSQEWGKSPIVIAGDLNSMPQSALYQFLSSSELDILMHDRREISGQVGFSLRQKSFSSPSMYNKRCPMPMPSLMRYRWSEEEMLLASGSRGRNQLQHPLKLCSAYPGVPGNHGTRDSNGEPVVTSYHSKFMGTVDYIWHSTELVPVGVVETLPINTLRKVGGLPSQKWGSDHLALVCEFAFVDDADQADSSHNS